MVYRQRRPLYASHGNVFCCCLLFFSFLVHFRDMGSFYLYSLAKYAYSTKAMTPIELPARPHTTRPTSIRAPIPICTSLGHLGGPQRSHLRGRTGAVGRFGCKTAPAIQALALQCIAVHPHTERTDGNGNSTTTTTTSTIPGGTRTHEKNKTRLHISAGHQLGD